MIQGDFHRCVGSESVGLSQGQFRLVVQSLDGTGAIGATPVAHRRWQGALPTQNAVQQRHHTRCVRAAEFSGAACRASTQATG